MLQRSLPNVRPSMIMAGMCLAFLPSALSFQSNGMALRPFETMLRGACQRRRSIICERRSTVSEAPPLRAAQFARAKPRTSNHE
jgi:hypothetical protein